MKIAMITKGFYGIGLITSFVSIYLWTVKYEDLSQLIFGLNVALVFFFIGYAYSWMREQREEIKELNNGLDALRKWAVDELEKEK